MSTTVRVSGEAVKDLRLAVVKVHGKLRGYLREELDQAIKLHADRLTETEEEESDG